MPIPISELKKRGEIKIISTPQTFDAQLSPVLNAINHPSAGETARNSIGSLLDKIGGVITGTNQAITGIGKGMINVAAGTTIGATKKLGQTIVESGKALITGQEPPRRQGFDVLGRGEIPSKANIIFAGIETYPGGGQLTKLLKGMPKGEEIAGALTKLINYLPEKMKISAINQYYKVLNPTKEKTKALTSKLTPQALARGEIITDLGKTAEKAKQKARELGGQIDAFVEALPDDKKTTIYPILQKFNSFWEKYTAEGKVMKQEALDAVNDVAATIYQYGREVSNKTLVQLRRVFDEHFDVSKGLTDLATYTKKVERIAGNAIREELVKAEPKLAALNNEFTFWQSLATVAKKSAERKIGQLGGVSKLAARGAGAIVGAEGTPGGFTEKAGGATLGYFLGKTGLKIISSPAWRSISAISKNRLADAIIKGDKATIGLIISKMAAGIKNLTNELIE